MKEGKYFFEFCCDTILSNLDSRGWLTVGDLKQMMVFVDHKELLKALLYLESEKGYVKRDLPLDKSSLSNRINSTPIIITNSGTGFIKISSFLEESRKRDQEAVLREQNYRKGELDIRSIRWALKFKWWPLAISFAGLIISAFVVILSITWRNEDQKQSSKRKSEIDDLRLTLQATRNEILHKVDSLYRKEHIPKPKKKGHRY